MVGAAGEIVAQLTPGGDQLGERLGIGADGGAVRDAADEPGDRFGIEAVVLGHGPARHRELADSQGVEAVRGKVGVEQCLERIALVAAAGLEPDSRRSQTGQPTDQRGPASPVVGKAPSFARRPEADVELSLGDIDADKDPMSCI